MQAHLSNKFFRSQTYPIFPLKLHNNTVSNNAFVTKPTAHTNSTHGNRSQLNERYLDKMKSYNSELEGGGGGFI